MKEGFRQCMAWLHTWTGLLFGWLLFAIFATGTSAYFQEEITAWMQPEARAPLATQEVAVENATGWLARKAPDAHMWSIVPPSARTALTQVYWELEEGVASPSGQSTEATLDSAGNETVARKTQGGLFLYRFHYELHYLDPIAARWIVGIAAMFMLVALVSGVITHKKIFADFFLLRLGKGQRSWLDAHNVAGVFVLPFCLMITYTGLVTLGGQYMPWGVAANYADLEAFSDEAYPHAHPPERSGKAAPLAPLGPMLATARASFGGNSLGFVTVSNPGDATATVEVSASNADSIAIDVPGLLFDGTTGQMIRGPHDLGGATVTEGVLYGLHMGRYARPVLRWLYFLSGLAGTALIATGLVLWTVKRRAKLPDPARPHFGFRLVEKLNVATIAGLPAGIAVYFLANRLLPVELPLRDAWEIHSMFIAWGGIAVWAFARPAARGWVELLSTVAVLFAAVPLVGALTVGRSLPASIAAGDWVFAGFDLVVLALAAGFAFAARQAARRAGRAPSVTRPALAEANPA